MMSSGGICIACKSVDTEWLMQVGKQNEYGCNDCSTIWRLPIPTHEAVYDDSLTQYVEKGDEP